MVQTLTREQRRSNIRKALQRVRAARGGVTGFVSGTGRVKGIVPPAPKISAGQKARIERDRKRIEAVRLKRVQREEAQKRIGSIRQVVSGKEKNPVTGRFVDVITFVGATGKKFTVPKEGLKFTARQKFGGIPSKEQPLPSMSRVQAARLEKKFQTKVDQLLVRQEARRVGKEPKVKKAPVTARPKLKISGFEKRVLKLKKQEIEAAKRVERAEDPFRLIPSLGGESFAQRFARDALAFPTRATFGLGEQVIISSGKLTAAIEGLFKRGTRREVIQQSKQALTKTPSAIAQSFDVRDPEALVTLIAIAFGVFRAGKVVRGKNVLRPKKGTVRVKKGKAQFNKGTKNVASVQKGSYTNAFGKKVNFEIRRTFNQKGKGTVMTTIRDTRGKLILQVRGKSSLIGKARKTRMSRSKIRKLKRKEIRKTLIEEPKVVKKVRLKERKRQAAVRARQQLVREIREKKIPLTPKVRASVRKLIRKEILAKRSVKPLKIPKGFFEGISRKAAVISKSATKQLLRLKKKEFKTESAIRARKQLLKEISEGKQKIVPQLSSKIRKILRKEIIGRRSIRPLAVIKENVSTLRELTLLRQNIKVDIKKPTQGKIVINYGKSKKIRSDIKKQKAKTRKSPFSPKERVKEIKKLNLADKKAEKSQKQLQGAGQTTITLLKKKEIVANQRKIVQIRRAKTVTEAQQRFSSLSKIMGRQKSKLTQNRRFALNIDLALTAKQLLKQIVLINTLFRTAQKAKAAVAAKAKPKVKPKVIQKPKVKPKPVVKPKPIAIQEVRQKLKSLQKLAQKTKSKVTQKQIKKSIQKLKQRLRKRLLEQRRLKRKLEEPPTKKEKKLLKFINKNKRFIFTPDLAAIVFGEIATPKQARALLRKGRIFTGLENRLIVRAIRSPRKRKRIVNRVRLLRKKIR